MANVTYLLGAGASCNALPTYQNFGERFKIFLDTFLSHGPIFNGLDSDYRSRAQNLYYILNLFNAEFKYHNTPDTIAKKYFHTQSTDSGLNLKMIKQILILFFLYEQTIDPYSCGDLYKKSDLNNKPYYAKDTIDKRYDSLVASLLKPIQGELSLLNNFNILTWNYDLQFELSFGNYLGVNGGLKNVQSFLQSSPRIHEENSIQINDDFSIIHLNGIAYPKGSVGFNIGNSTRISTTFVEQLLDIYKAMNSVNSTNYVNTQESLLNFAWENMDHEFKIKNSEHLNKAFEIAAQTEYLVIIGYSFPIFNSVIDQALLGRMVSLIKVYIQSPESNKIYRMLSNGIIGRRQIEIEEVGYVNSFHIPDEWNQKYS